MMNENNGNGENKCIWIFNGTRNKYPSAVFEDLELAKNWIEENKLTGTLTAYPINISVYDWAISLGHFRANKVEQTTANFIGNFSSASQQHFHFEDGKM